MKRSISKIFTVAMAFWVIGQAAVSAQENELVVQVWTDKSKAVPIVLSGFTGEAEAVLKFDLYVAGFEFVGADKAKFAVSGSNNGELTGRLLDAQKNQLFGQKYSGGSIRQQAHAFADDLLKQIYGQKMKIFGSKIAYKVDQGRNQEIGVADFDGNNATLITRDGSLVSSPAWVPGTRRLIYASWKSGGPFLLQQDLTSGARDILSSQPGSNHSPAVSPDGKRVALILSKDGNPELYVMGTDGGGLKRLTTTKEDEASPCWSPDGQTICFSSRYGGRPTLHQVSANGGAMRRMNVVGVANHTEPDWSPDGKTIIFTAQMGSFQICTVPAGGGSAVPLVEGEDPVWGANSRVAMFTKRAGGQRTLSLLDVPTKHVKDLPRLPGSCSQAAWAR